MSFVFLFIRRFSWFGATLGFAAGIAPALTAAGLEWAQPVIETNAAFEQTDVKASFAFHNASDRRVTITSVNATCDCTTAELEKKTYAPGEKGRIDVMFEIGDYSGEHDTHILVSTDIPSEPPSDLVLRVHIPEYLRVLPRKAIWSVGADASEKTITCTAATAQSVKMIEVNSSDPDLVARIEERKAGRDYVLHLQPRSTARQLAATIQMSVAIEGVGTRTFNAYGYVTGP
jgi:hypothetical protein